jgi:hypothetical protein
MESCNTRIARARSADGGDAVGFDQPDIAAKIHNPLILTSESGVLRLLRRMQRAQLAFCKLPQTWPRFLFNTV